MSDQERAVVRFLQSYIDDIRDGKIRMIDCSYSINREVINDETSREASLAFNLNYESVKED